jgi:proteic killer suppression protein
MLDRLKWGRHDSQVIESFRHKGLARLFEDDDRRKVPASHADKIVRIVARLNEAVTVQNMGLPGYQLHPLKGKLAGFGAVSVSGNWRIIFRFENASAHDVDLIDYH